MGNIVAQRWVLSLSTNVNFCCTLKTCLAILLKVCVAKLLYSELIQAHTVQERLTFVQFWTAAVAEEAVLIVLYSPHLAVIASCKQTSFVFDFGMGSNCFKKQKIQVEDGA